jgi:ketosteroid isomerase-like protein
MTFADIAIAFSQHRFHQTYDLLADHVRWITVGEKVTEGRDAVVAACTASAAELTDVRTDFDRFVVVAGTDAVAVDAIGRYTDADGTVSIVSSCDVYEFDDGMITTITTYAVELVSAAADSSLTG